MTGTEKDRFCQVRKVMDGVYKSIQKTEDNKCGFEINKWHSFTVKITSKQWIFYLSKENEGLAEVLKMDADEELQKGFIALMTYETKAAFSNIKTMPLEDFQFKETGVEVVSVEQINNDENKGSEDGGQNQSNESPKTKKNKEKAAEYEGCLEKKTPEEREKYCKAKFEDDKTAQTDCKVRLLLLNIDLILNFYSLILMEIIIMFILYLPLHLFICSNFFCYQIFIFEFRLYINFNSYYFF